MKEKLLVIGGSGSLGRQLIKDLKNEFDIVGTGTYCQNKDSGLIHLDISDKGEVDDVFRKENPSIVIIAAAKTNVEACELDPNDTFRINAYGIENIIGNCKGLKVIFYSTDNIFDGTKRLYKEEDEPNPINIYGKSKLEGERLVKKIQSHLICRSSRFYSLEKNCPKYLNHVISLLGNNKEIRAPINTIGNFTFIPDISQATLKLIKQNKIGTYHVAGSDVYSLCEAALKVADVFGFDKSLIIPVGQDYFNSKVKRPTCPLDIAKLSNEGIKMSSLEDGLEKIKNYYSKASLNKR